MASWPVHVAENEAGERSLQNRVLPRSVDCDNERLAAKHNCSFLCGGTAREVLLSIVCMSCIVIIERRRCAVTESAAVVMAGVAWVGEALTSARTRE